MKKVIKELEAIRRIIAAKVTKSENDGLPAKTEKFIIQLDTAIYQLKTIKREMPNGLDNWKETYYEVVCHLNATTGIELSMANQAQHSQGTGGLYELADQLTTEFETLHKGHFWDGDFFDTISEFLESKDKALIHVG